MRAELFVAALLVLASCREATKIEVDAPANLAAVAVLVLDENGEVLESSELRPWGENEALPIVAAEDSKRVVLAGYTKSQLAIYFGELTPSGSLRRADTCEPRLPPPAWFARWTGPDALSVADPNEAPAMTADFAAGVCQDLTDSVIEVELRCTGPRCPATSAAPIACKQSLDLTDCGLGLSTITFDAAGESCLVTTTAPEDCRIDVFVAQQAATPPFDQLERRLFGEELYLPAKVRELGVINPAAFFEGRAYDLAPLDDRVAIAASPDGAAWYTCPDEDLHTREQLIFVDPETLMTIASATVPPCLQRLMRDEDQNGVIATFAGANDTWSIGRFDESGNQTAEASTEVPFGYRRVFELAYLDEDRIIVLAQLSGGATLLVLVDRATLARLDTIELEDFNAGALGVVDANTVALVSANLLSVAWVDVGARVIRERQDIPPNLVRNWGFFGAQLDPLDKKLLVAARGEAEMYRFVRGSTQFERARLLGGEGSMQTIAPWPLDQKLWLAGGTNVPSFEASVTLFDSEEMRFRPGRWTIGEGIVGRMRLDDGGRIWALLPWAGKVVRLTPR